VCRTHENFWDDFFALVIYGRRLHHNRRGPKHQKQKRVHVEQRPEVAVLNGTAENNLYIMYIVMCILEDTYRITCTCDYY